MAEKLRPAEIFPIMIRADQEANRYEIRARNPHGYSAVDNLQLRDALLAESDNWRTFARTLALVSPMQVTRLSHEIDSVAEVIARQSAGSIGRDILEALEAKQAALLMVSGYLDPINIDSWIDQMQTPGMPSRRGMVDLQQPEFWRPFLGEVGEEGSNRVVSTTPQIVGGKLPEDRVPEDGTD